MVIACRPRQQTGGDDPWTQPIRYGLRVDSQTLAQAQAMREKAMKWLESQFSALLVLGLMILPFVVLGLLWFWELF